MAGVGELSARLERLRPFGTVWGRCDSTEILRGAAGAPRGCWGRAKWSRDGEILNASAGSYVRDTVSAWPIKGHQRRLRGNGLQGKTVRVYGLNLSLIFEAIVLTLGLI